MQEIIDFLKLIWDLKTVLIIAVVFVVLVLLYGKILVVVDQHKKVFGKGDRKDD